MRPPIYRARPTHEDDEDEAKELHQAEIEMGLDDRDERGDSRVKTHLYDSSAQVHVGRLGALERTLRLISSSVRRSFGRFSAVEEDVDRAERRIAAVELAVLTLGAFAALALGGMWAAGLAAVLSAIYFWGWP